MTVFLVCCRLIRVSCVLNDIRARWVEIISIKSALQLTGRNVNITHTITTYGKKNSSRMYLKQ